MVTLTNSLICEIILVVLPGGEWWFCLVVLVQAQWCWIRPSVAGSGPVVTVGSSGPGNDGNILWFVFTVSVARLVLLCAARQGPYTGA